MNKRILLVLRLLATLIVFIPPVRADDCSSAADCSQVIYGSGWLGALLALLLGSVATTPTPPKELACKLADELKTILKIFLVLLAVMALVAIIMLLFEVPPPGYYIAAFIVLAVLTLMILYYYYQMKHRCEDP